MSSTAERMRAMGLSPDEDREAWELGRKVLSDFEERLGPELVAALVGAWLGKHHRERPRLMYARPEAPARAQHYLAFVREQDCAWCQSPGTGVIHAHHHGPRGMGQKTDDYRTVPLCARCHNQEHAGAYLDNGEERDIYAAQIDTLVRYLRIVEQT